MSPATVPAAACILCGATDAERSTDGWRCRVCGWRRGDSPDADLPRPRVDVVYYVRYRERIKIGTTHDPRQRLRVIRHDDLLAFELGGRAVERARHEQFADVREGGEWFTATPELLAWTAVLAQNRDPWHTHARWMAEALARLL